MSVRDNAMGNVCSAVRCCTENPNDAPDVNLPLTTEATSTTVPTPSTVSPSTCPNDSCTVDLRPTNEAASTTIPRFSTTSSSAYPSYDVFISHAGTDKATIAIPLREKLKEKGINAFVDVEDLRPGIHAPQAMIHAMETASVAVIILSPEFVSRRWPMRELLHFLTRRENSEDDAQPTPVVIPFFYRLKIADLQHEPRLDRKDNNGKLLYDSEESKFYERQKAGEPEANIEKIGMALKTVRNLTGVLNFVEASNDSSYEMSRKREVLLEDLRNKVGEAIPCRAIQSESEGQRIKTGHSEVPCEEFRSFFPLSSSVVRAVLDFDYKNEADKPRTTEGKVKQFLLENGRGSPHVVSLHGMGGVGKSTILQALSVDDQIRRKFRDGVHVIKLGKDASSAELLRQICRILKESGAEKTYQSLHTKNDIDEAMMFFERWFDGKRCAFFIDDVWKHDIGLGLLSHVCNMCSTGEKKVLMTTREVQVASLVPDARAVRLEPREPTGLYARRMLLFHAGCKESDASDALINDAIKEVLKTCAGLPVALAVAGKNVRMMRSTFANNEPDVWKQYLCELNKRHEQLLKEDVGDYENLFAMVATSIAILDKQSRKEIVRFPSKLSVAKMYRRLCVLQKQAIVPESMLKHLWETESVDDVKVIARKFSESGLASLKLVEVREENVYSLSLHDSLHDFAVAEAKDHDEMKEAHNCLLNGYKSNSAQTPYEWWSKEVERDGYIHGNVCRHLVEAGRIRELLRLLLSPQWVERQMEVNDILFLQADFSIGMKAIEEGLRDETEEKREEIEKALRLISDAATMSSMFISSNGTSNGTSNRIESYFQVHGRLIESAKMSRVIGDYVCRIEADDRRPRILCKSSFLQQAGESYGRSIHIGVSVMCMTLMKDKEHIACGCDDGRIVMVDLKRNVIEKQWRAHDTYVTAIAISRDGMRLVSHSDDDTTRVWEVETGHGVASFTGHSRGVEDIAVMKDGKRVISISGDGTGNIWDIETGEISRLHNNSKINCVEVLPDEEDLVVTGGWDGKLRILNVTTGAQVGGTFDGHDDWVNCIAVTPDGQYIVSGSFDNTVRVWDVRSHEQLGNPLQGDTSWITCVAVSGDGRRLVSASHDNTIRVWDLETRTHICDPLKGHTNRVTGVVFLDGADRIVSSSWDVTLRVWDVTRKNSKSFTNRHESTVLCVSFTPNGRAVVSGSRDKTLRIWDTNSGQQLGAPLKGHSFGVTDVTVTPNGRCAVSVSDDCTVRIWDLESHNLLRTLTGHTESVQCVAVSPNGDYIVTASGDETVRVWSLATTEGSPVVFEGHPNFVMRVFVSDDSMRVVSVGWDHNIFVWEVKTKKLVKEVKQEDAWRLSRKEVLNLVDESTVQDHTTLSVPLYGRQIFYDGPSATVLVTVESDIFSWALSPDQKMICVGMRDGHVGFLKLET